MTRAQTCAGLDPVAEQLIAGSGRALLAALPLRLAPALQLP
jgi:hypothetical protein